MSTTDAVPSAVKNPLAFFKKHTNPTTVVSTIVATLATSVLMIGLANYGGKFGKSVAKGA